MHGKKKPFMYGMFKMHGRSFGYLSNGLLGEKASLFWPQCRQNKVVCAALSTWRFAIEMLSSLVSFGWVCAGHVPQIQQTHTHTHTSVHIVIVTFWRSIERRKEYEPMDVCNVCDFVVDYFHHTKVYNCTCLRADVRLFLLDFFRSITIEYSLNLVSFLVVSQNEKENLAGF